MNASERWTSPSVVQVARVVLACSDLAEFERDFLPRYRTEGVFVATRCRNSPRIGDRIQVKVELLDNSIGYVGEAMVAALDQEGSCPGMRVLLNPPPVGAQVAEPAMVAQPEIENIQVSMADWRTEPIDRQPAPEIKAEIEPIQVTTDDIVEDEPLEIIPEVDADAEIEPVQTSTTNIDSVSVEIEPDEEMEAEVLPVADDPLTAPTSWLGSEQTKRRQPHLAEWFETLAAGALRSGDLETAEAHCQLGIQADPERMSLRTLLQGIEAQRRTDPAPESAHP